MTPFYIEMVKTGAADLYEGLLFWRISLHLGLNDIRIRYRRSTIGQNWQTLSMAVFLGATTLIYSVLLGVDVHIYAPYITCSFACWTLLSTLITEATHVYISSETLLKHYSIPKSVCLYQLVIRNIAVFFHNVVLLIPAFVLTGKSFTPTAVLILPVLLVYAINGIWLAAILGAISARFRDVPQIVASIIQIMFILTPVMYMAESAGPRQKLVSDWNPLSHMLALGRDVLMGNIPAVSDVVIVTIITIFGSVIGFFVFCSTRRKILYWL